MTHHPFLLSVYIFAITVLVAVMEAIAEGIAQIIAAIFTVLIGGFITAIISALTGRRVQMPQIPTIHSRNRSAPRKANVSTIPRELCNVQHMVNVHVAT